MSGIKHRTLVHIALNAKGERVAQLICVAGHFIPVFGHIELNLIRCKPVTHWLKGFVSHDGVADWKRSEKVFGKAVRFQRVMLVGGDA